MTKKTKITTLRNLNTVMKKFNNNKLNNNFVYMML